MATPAQIDEQVKLEREQIKLGLQKLSDNTRALEGKSYASASVYGIASIETLLPLVIKQIEETNERIHQRKNGTAFKEIKHHLKTVEPLAAATIALKITFDKVFSYKQANSQLSNVVDAIGKAVEEECLMRYYEQEAPGLLHVLKENYWHRSIGTPQKVTVIKTLMNRYDVKKWETWGRANRIRLGNWL